MTPTLQSGPSQLTIDLETGRLAGLCYGARTFVSAATAMGPLRLHLPLPDFEAHLVEADSPQVQTAGDRLRLSYPDLAGARGRTGIAAAIEIEVGDDGAFVLRCRIDNGSAIAIPQILFPLLGGFLQQDGPDDCVTFAKSRFHPWREWDGCPPDRRMTFMHASATPEYLLSPNYPYTAGMKWLDFGGREAGVTLFSREKTSSAQFMRVSTENPFHEPARTIALSWVHYPFIQPGESWASPEFVLWPHDGDWRHGVLKYKEHADRTYVPAPTTTDRDATIGQQTLWAGWHYQDWQKPKLRFADLPGIAAEARAAGFRELTLARATVLDFCLPHVVRPEMGSPEELRDAVEQARRNGVNITPFTTCRLIREETIPADREAAEWFAENAAHQRHGDNWTYDPAMTPKMPIHQLGSRGAWYTCAGSRHWRQAFLELVDQVANEWGCRGLMFDQSMEVNNGHRPLCFNPRHTHRPGEVTTLLNDVLAEAHQRLRDRFGDEAVISGESQWDAASEWMAFTWDWLCLEEDERMAPFHMAFPRARQCLKCTDYLPQINRIFTSGYWLDLYLEDGSVRLGDYPELTRYLASLAAFKARFSRFFNERDYLYTLGTHCADEAVWRRAHRSGNDALVMATTVQGAARQVPIELDIRVLTGVSCARVSTWTRDLRQLTATEAGDSYTAHLDLPHDDLLGIHLEGQA